MVQLTRRNFIKTGSLTTAAGFAGISTVIGTLSCFQPFGKRAGKKGLSLKFRPYNLQLKHSFNLAGSSRTITPVMLTEVSYEGVTGYGEASMPPYLGESHQSAEKFLSMVNLGQFSAPFELETILNYIDSITPGNFAAKASVDIALHDLVGKLIGQPWYKIWGYDPRKTPNTSFTIGIDTEDIVRQKVREANPYKILKVKLGRDNDKEMIEFVRKETDVPICVDVNQGWRDKHIALEMIHWLEEKGTVFVEQPMPKEMVDDMAWLTERSPLPTIGDEAVQRIADVKNAQGVYSGINIKLMKCTGMREAHKMLNLALSLNMRVMIGCMTETSCAVSAAAQLSPMTSWCDLDGNLLIKNDVFEGVKIINGKVTLNERPGIGISKASL